MENQFSKLIPEHTIDQEFIDFLYEWVEKMTLVLWISVLKFILALPSL